MFIVFPSLYVWVCEYQMRHAATKHMENKFDGKCECKIFFALTSNIENLIFQTDSAEATTKTWTIFSLWINYVQMQFSL